MAYDIITSNQKYVASISSAILKLNEHDHANKTSAGFIYQDLVLIKKLLYLENDGTTISYEVLDDIHIIKENSTTLVQVKHSVNDTPLTERSSDFWKTINKWAKIIEALNDEKLKFVFYTNRQTSVHSKLYNALQQETKDYIVIEKIISDLFDKLQQQENEKKIGSPQNPIFKYVKKIHELSLENKKALFNKLIFEISDQHIVDEIKKKLKYFGVTNSLEIDRAYERLLGIVTDKRYSLAREGKDFLINYEYFRKDLKFDSLLNLAKHEEIDFDTYYDFKNEYNEDYHGKTFYKQLKDIDVQDSLIQEYARERAKASSFFKELDLVSSEEEVINKKICEEWKYIYEDIYEEKISDENHHKRQARDCLKQTKNANVRFKQSDLPKDFIKGILVDLSNIPRIGWRQDWKEKYCE